MSHGKITCQICGSLEHSIQLHLRNSHPDVTLESYTEVYSDAPLLSNLAKQKLADGSLAKTKVAATEVKTPVKIPKLGAGKKYLHEAFGFSEKEAGVLSATGSPIPITVLESSEENKAYVPEVSDKYIYSVDELKNVILALELNIPCYVWGHKGSGKTELWEQVAARTNRPIIRVQHTVNTEESHIVGQWTVKDGATVFEMGPLPLAMKNGWVYMADEYDFALPSVLSVYQSVLEGKSLMIKEADAENRITKPHPNFRFVATGNTNGSGDESGLYQGTNLQNSANYDRFGVVIHKNYLKRDAESLILQGSVGLNVRDANKMVDFANKIRDAFNDKKISDTISPRSLKYASMLGLKRASFTEGIKLAFTNKLSTVDRETVTQVMQRVFGE